MILAFDVGNTHTVMGCIDQGKTRNITRIKSDKSKTEYEYAATIKMLLSFSGVMTEDIDGAIISSVVPPVTASLTKAVELLCKIKPMVVGAGVKTGVNIQIDNPAEVGSDLVVGAAAVLKYYKVPAIIIDMGTATTFSALDDSGAFVGGAIVPGVVLSLNALTEGASLLPRIPLEPPKAAIGRNTIECMKSGSILGSAAMVDGMLDRMKKELSQNEVTVIATGGIAPSVVPLCRHEITLDDELLFKGLWVIYEKNCRR